MGSVWEKDKSSIEHHTWQTTAMRRMLTGDAINFNHRHRRHGHLFQNRYKSILCQEDAYLLELVRSSGGWVAVKAPRVMKAHMKSNECILGDDDFVSAMLANNDEAIDSAYMLKAKGFELAFIPRRVADLLVWSQMRSGSQGDTNDCRCLLCYWAVRKLNISMAGLIVPAFGYIDCRRQ